MRDEKGVALMITLWVLVLVSVVATSFALSARLESAGARNFKEETEAYYAAVSAYEAAVSYILTDKDPAVDFLDEDGVYWTDNTRPSPAGRQAVGGIEVDVRISDEESRLNINTAPDAALRRMFLNAGIPSDEIEGLMDSLADWKDIDELHRLSGAESDYYESLDAPYKAKNGLLDAPEELLLVRGFKPEYLYGGGDISAVLPYISAHAAALNINTAPAGLLELLGLPSTEIEALMKQRTSEFGGLRTIHQSALTAVPLTTASTNIRVEVTAAAPGGRAVKLTAVLKRIAGPRGPELKTIYWKEGIESSGY